MRRIELTFGTTGRDGVKYSPFKVDKFIEEYVLPAFNSFTLTNGVGSYKGKPEYAFTLTIYIIPTTEDRIKIQHICSEYCRIFDQECVLFVETEVNNCQFIREKDKLQKHDRFLSLVDDKRYVVREVKDGIPWVTMITNNPMQDDPNWGALIEWKHDFNYVIINP